MIPNLDPNKLLMQGIHVELTPAMQERIRDKFTVVLSRSAEIIRVHVHLHLDQKSHVNHFTAKGRIEIGGPDLTATAEGADAYGVIDGLANKLDHLLERRHGMRKDRRHSHVAAAPEV
jgi:putative sigma-54 modulation protein